MTPAPEKTPRLTLLLSALLAALLLGACGEGADDAAGPPPTLARLEDLAAGASPAAAASLTAPPLPSASATQAPTESPTASFTPSRTVSVASYTPQPTQTDPPPAPTDSPAPPTETPPPGDDPIALTNTAIALNRPLTLTARPQATPIEIASPSPSPSPTPPPTASPAVTQAQPAPAIVFYSDRRGQEDIYLTTLDGTPRAITGSAANEREPSCAPDGSAVIYASDTGGRFQIYRQPLDRTEAVPLTDSAGMNFAPVFSPDGSTIAFVSTRADGIPTIWLMDADGGNQRQLTTPLGRDTSPAWGPDGRQLLFASEQEDVWDLFITITNNDAGELGEFPMLPPEFSAGNQVWPVFDAAGERVAYTAWSDLADPQTADIYLLDFEQPEPVAVRAGEGADIAWGWLDETRLLASLGGPDDVQIVLVDVASGAVTPLTDAGTFNGGARPCPVDPARLPPEPTPAPTFTPAPTATPTPEPASSWLPPALVAVQGRPHIVQPGENLLGISYVYGISWQRLVALNALPDPDRLSIGQRLTIPVTRTGYRPSGYQLPDSDRTGVTGARSKEIVVRLDAQEVDVFEEGRLLHTFTVSTGLPETPTVLGEYKIYHKLPSQTMTGPGYYLPGVPWVMYFYQGYGLHGTYWHDNFGQPMSHGCVNLRTPDARWLFAWAEIGTPVVVQP